LVVPILGGRAEPRPNPARTLVRTRFVTVTILAVLIQAGVNGGRFEGNRCGRNRRRASLVVLVGKGPLLDKDWLIYPLAVSPVAG
jgi:hypothetical protein